MSITGVDLSSEPGSRKCSINAKRETEYTYVFTVESDNFLDDSKYIRDNLSYPYPSTPLRIATVHPADTNAFCIGIDPEFVARTGDGGALWKATVRYGVWEPFEYVENPLDAPILPLMEGTTKSKVFSKDKDGNPIVNKAGDGYDPPVEREVPREIYRFRIRTAAKPTWLAYKGYINSSAWQGFASYTVRFMVSRSEQIYSQYLGSTYYETEVEFHVDEDTHLANLPNQGFRQLVSGNLQPILVNGQPATAPVWLDSSGAALMPPITSSNFVINTFHVDKEVDFNSIFSFFPTDVFGVYTGP